MNYFDILLAKKLNGGGGGDITVESLSVTENGTYSEEGKAYSPVNVNVQPPENSYQLKSITTPTSLATFEASAMPMPSLKVSVEAQQDLHGYDKPWVGGAGKNKAVTILSRMKTANINGTWSDNVYSYGGITITVLFDGDGNINGIKANGTATANVIFILTRSPQDDMTLPTGNYILSGCPTGGSTATYSLNINRTVSGSPATYGNDTGSGLLFTCVDSSAITGMWIQIMDGTNLQNAITFYPMVRLATESATFAPYSNICPISGWDAANISDVGKNLLDSNLLTLFSSNKYIATINYNIQGAIAVKPNTPYCISFASTLIIGDGKVIFWSPSGTQISMADIRSKTTFTTPSNCVSISFFAGQSNSQSSIDDFEAQLELGSSATTYEPYNGKTVTIQFGQTVYGGEVDVVNGELKILYELKRADSLTWQKNSSDITNYLYFTRSLIDVIDINKRSNVKCSEAMMATNYPSTEVGCYVHTNGVCYLNFLDAIGTNDLPSFNNFLTTDNVTILIPLATPIIIPLTPSLIKSLNGQNNLSVDCGEIVEGEYFKAL